MDKATALMARGHEGPLLAVRRPLLGKRMEAGAETLGVFAPERENSCQAKTWILLR